MPPRWSSLACRSWWCVKYMVGTATCSAEPQLQGGKRFGITFSGPALHAAQTRQSTERFGVEPVLAALGGEVGIEQRQLALHDLGRERQVNIGPPKIAVPLRDFVLEDEVVTKRRP